MGAGLWTLATIMEATEALLSQPRFGTVADCAWVGGYVLVLAGFASGAGPFGGWKSSRSKKAGAIWLSIAGLVLMAILFSFMPHIDRPVVLALGWIYYVSDSALVFLALICAYGSKTEELQPSLKLFVWSCVLFYSFDLVVILQQVTSPLDRWTGPGYATGYFLMHLAGEYASAQRLSSTSATYLDSQ